MKFKQTLACLLAAATLVSLPTVLPAASAAQAAPSGFTDISDPAVAEAAELLRLLGVVNGTGEGAAFNPNGSLTRAAFCKMAIEAMGRGSDAAAQANRTIFDDVKGSYWARGYINLAATIPVGADAEGSGGEKLMMGVGDATFRPEESISYAQAVTILMRVLGYGSQSVASGTSWFDGYLSTAKAIGLTEGVELSPDSVITRGQTAILFENLLYTKPNGGKDPFLTTLGGQILPEAILLNLDATAEDGATGAIQVTDGSAVTVYKTDHAPFDPSLAGLRAKLVLDKDGKVLAVEPSATGSRRTVTVVSAELNYLNASGGERIAIDPAAVVYQGAEQKTYKDLYLNLKAGDQLTLHFSAAGKLEHLFRPTVDAAASAAIAKEDGDPFDSLVAGDTGYRVIKNGVSASRSDIRKYDAATYDKSTKTLFVSDLRLTGFYENVSPSPVTPLSVTVLGAQFPVLPSAYDDFARFQIGDPITILLTIDGQVAGAVAPAEARSTAVGVVEMEGQTATVTPLMDLRDPNGKKITLTGETRLSDYNATQIQGQLVTIVSEKWEKGTNYVTLSRISGESVASAALDVSSRKLGGETLADNVVLYEQVGNGKPTQISFAQLTRETVPAAAIRYVGRDYAGRVNILVFDDVTGDLYTYGLSKKGESEMYRDGMSFTNPNLYVEAAGKSSDRVLTNNSYKDGTPLGVAPSLASVADGVYKLAGLVELNAVTGVPRAAFALNASTPAEGDLSPLGTVTVGSDTYPIAGNVACYNATTKSWFGSLDEARAYSATLTVYCDRAPEDGGKIRLVVAE